MGRHRRSEPQLNHDPRPAWPPAAPPDGRPRGGQHRRQHPARAGMLGTSAALAVGAVAMSSGLLGNAYDLDPANDPTEQVQAKKLPLPTTQGSSSAPVPKSTTTSPDTDRKPTREAPKPTPSKPSTPGETASSPSTTAPDPTRTAEPEPSTQRPEPERTVKPSAKTTDATAAAEAEVLRLVNQERLKAGCRPVAADPSLAELAGDYSKDMAERDFFDHTDPDGDDPWDRATGYGITDLGGENIARGQANAQSVMDSWMQSEGHRANILNCDFKTLGVGAYFAEGGPWWTQNFGY